MATPQDEALDLFGAVIRDMSGPTPDIKSALRRCQHGCRLVNWREQQEWFGRELTGYPADVSVPWYRVGHGNEVWRFCGSPFQWLGTAVTDDLADEATPIAHEFRDAIDNLLVGSQRGSDHTAGRVEERYDVTLRRRFSVERRLVYPASVFADMTRRLEQQVYDFASRAYEYLRYGSALTDVWTGYRTRVDVVLHTLGLTNHLDAIQAGLRSANPEEWRKAVFACRNTLEDVARLLWQDPRPTYAHLHDAKGGEMQVTQERYANRLAAYLHQKGVGGTRGKFLRDEVERLAVSFRSLIGVQGKAHEPVTMDDARTVALATYFLLGELAIRTDMQPVNAYRDPASATDDKTT